MERLKQLSRLARPADTRILLFVVDGLGGLPSPETGMTELDTAELPHFDRFVQRSATGRSLPVGEGIASGSGPGHLGLFGYPADQIELGRGVLEVLGASRVFSRGQELAEPFTIKPGDLTARGNFAQVVEGSLVVEDRRGGYPSDSDNLKMIQQLSEKIEIPGIEIFLFPGRQHRFAVAFRIDRSGHYDSGSRLTGPLCDTDPLQVGKAVVPAVGEGNGHQLSEAVVAHFMEQVHQILGSSSTPNYALLRGLGTLPEIPGLNELYGLKGAALATYPMYRGVAQLVGMKSLDTPDQASQLSQLKAHFDDFDLFFVHFKETDSEGHKGDFEAKCRELEKADAFFGACLEHPFDVVVLTGDHSTPTVLKDHSHHPVPTAIWSKHCLRDHVDRFSERSVVNGTLGKIMARDILAYALAEASRLNKFGA